MLKPNIPITVKPEVLDGDTFKFSHKGSHYFSRAKWIDCPATKKLNQSSDNELILKHWEYGQLAKQYLIDLVDSGKEIIIVPDKIDYYGRWLCNWFIGRTGVNSNIQLKLAKEGLAAYSMEINRYNFENDIELFMYFQIIKACVDSYKNKVGMWSVENFIFPSDFKKSEL